MRKEPNNFSFANKTGREDPKFAGLVDNVKSENDYLFSKNKDLAHFQHKKNFLQPAPYQSNSPINELTIKPLFPLGMTFSPRLDEMLAISSHRVMRTKTEENENEKDSSLGDLAIRASLTTDKRRIIPDSQRIELPAMSNRMYRGVKYYSNPGTIESPQATPHSARDHYDGSKRLYPSTPAEEQIEKFKILLRKHPEPRNPHRFSAHRKVRPKSQQPMINPLNLDFKTNLPEELVINHSNREYGSPDRSPQPGFLSERRALPPRPDQNILPTRPIIIDRKKHQQPHSVLDVSELLRKTRVITPQKVFRERSLTQGRSRGNSERNDTETATRPQSHENYSGRSNIRSSINNQRFFYGFYEFAQQHNSLNNHEPRQQQQPINAFDASIEQDPMDTFSYKPTKKFPFMPPVMKVSQPQSIETVQKTSFEENAEIDEKKRSQMNALRARIQSRSGKRIRVKPTFGFLDTSEIEANHANKMGQNDANKENGNKAAELRTPKFQAVGSDSVQEFEMNKKIKESNQISSNNDVSDRNNYVGFQSPVPYFRGNHMFKSNRAQTPPPNFSMDRSPKQI